MKIAIDSRGANWYRGTGIGTYTNELINSLLSIDTINQYFLYWAGSNYKDMYRDNVTLSLSSKRNHRFFEEYFIPSDLTRKDIDIYHVPQNGIGLPYNKNCTYISTIHDLIPYTMPETVGGGYLRKFISQMPKIVESSDKIITVSEFSKKDIVRIFGIPEEKVVVTHLAADHIFSPIDKSLAKSFIESKYKITSKYILYLGGFSKRKNVKSILEAFSKCYKNLSDEYKVVIIGPSRDEHADLSKLSKSLNIEDMVIFTGYVPHEHLPYFYSGASVFVYPSFYEGFGLPPLEAMSCKCPVITSNISSIPEIVGDASVLIDPYKLKDLELSLEKVLEDDSFRNNLIEKGYNRSYDFSWEKTALETLNVYKSTLEST